MLLVPLRCHSFHLHLCLLIMPACILKNPHAYMYMIRFQSVTSTALQYTQWHFSTCAYVYFYTNTHTHTNISMNMYTYLQWVVWWCTHSWHGPCIWHETVIAGRQSIERQVNGDRIAFNQTVANRINPVGTQNTWAFINAEPFAKGVCRISKI